MKQSKLYSIQPHAVGTPSKENFVNVTIDNLTVDFKENSGEKVPAVLSFFPALSAKLHRVGSPLSGFRGHPHIVLG